MLRSQLIAAARGARRTVPSLGLAAVLLTTILGAPISALAEDTQDDPHAPTRIVRDHRDGPIVRAPNVLDPNGPTPIVRDHSSGISQVQTDDPAARIQIRLRTIHVANDRDGALRGAGEFTLTASFFRCAGPKPPCGSGPDPVKLIAEWKRDFSAETGEAKKLDRLMPVAADVKNVSLASEDGGLALHDGHSYMFQVTMVERDTLGGDLMGGIQEILEKWSFWSVGNHERVPAGELKEPNFGRDGVDVCAGCGGIIVGDYLVTYEILPIALADLRPTAIRLLGDAGDGLEEVCLAVQNTGQDVAGPFNMSLFVDEMPALNGSVNVVGLGAGAPHEGCVRTSLPASGFHTLDLIVDQPRAVPEMNERNNQLRQILDRGPAEVTPTPTPTAPDGASPKPGSSASPTPGPILIQGPSQGKEQGGSQSQAELSVSTLRVNGQVPDGKNDCKDGKNTVSVVVKNAGTGKAEAFAVQLVVDDAQGAALEQSVSGLEPGREREVRFEDVRLKKGQHTLTATLTDKTRGGESKADDGKLTVTARCQESE